MRTFMIAVLLIVASPVLFAQASGAIPSSLQSASGTMPPGTILPVRLDNTLRVGHARPGDRVQATVMQSVPGTRLRRGAHLLGEVVAVTPAPHPSLTLRFTELRLRHGAVPVAVNLRAMASLLEVEEAETPEDMAMRGTVPQNATTRQIGGQQVYRGGGPVAEGMTPVGKPVAYGMVAQPLTRPGKSCRAEVSENRTPQAFWVFSSDACGLFGYRGLRIEHAGRTAPSGQIVFTSSGHRLVLQSGSGLLLRVLAGPQTTAIESGNEQLLAAR